MTTVATSMHGDIRVWPHQLITPVVESLEWLTDVIESHDGTEELTRLRSAPRLSVEVASTITMAQAAEAANEFYSSPTDLWALPLWWDVDTITVSSGSTSLTAQTDMADYRDSSLALLWSSVDDWEVVEVASVGGGYLTLSAPVAGEYTDAYVMPLRVGQISEAWIRRSDCIARAGFLWRCRDNAALASLNPETYLGDELYAAAPVIGDDGAVTDQIVARVDVLDYLIGTTVRFAPWTYSRPTRQHRVYSGSRSALWEWREFTHRRAGRYTPFWYPTSTADMALITTGVLTDVVEVADNRHPTERDHVLVAARDGTVYPRAVVDAQTTAPGVLRLTLDSAIGIDASLVKSISYLGYCRLQTDRIEIEHLCDGRARSSVSIVEISP